MHAHACPRGDSAERKGCELQNNHISRSAVQARPHPQARLLPLVAPFSPLDEHNEAGANAAAAYHAGANVHVEEPVVVVV
eukprot:2343814-Pleurochrysis_carterae.AAC.1